jgi:hypothetical protein
VENRQDRSSAMRFKLPWEINLPVPDGEITKLDRQQLLNNYTGIDADSVYLVLESRTVSSSITFGATVASPII